MNDIIYIETAALLPGDTDLAEVFSALDSAVEQGTLLEDMDALRQMAQSIRWSDDRRSALIALNTAAEQTRDALYA